MVNQWPRLMGCVNVALPPLVFVDRLPRDGNGKIQAAVLQQLIATHISKQV